MTKKILNFNGLFGDQVGPFDQSSIHHEPLQVRTIFYDFEIREHLHPDLFQLFFITSGGGLLLSSGEKIPLESPCVLVIPSNRLHGFVFQSEVQGEVFTIPDVFFEKVLKTDPTLFSKFNELQYFPLDSGANSFLELLDLKNKVINEISLSDSASALSLSLLLQLFFINLHRSDATDRVATIHSDDKALNHFYFFKKLIKQYVHEGKQVRFYAKEMNISTVHLNRVCQFVTQKTALQVIHEQVLKEAKKYLKGTQHSVAEIAYFLGFKDPAHFSKFFKKKEGLTPGAYRK